MKKLLFLLFTSFCLLSSAQNGATIHVFQPGQQSTVSQAHIDSMRVTDKNCLKWNWSVLTRGVFLIDYEFYISHNFSVEIGAGITYEDFLFEATKNIGNSDTVQQFLTSNSTYSYGTPSPNFCGEAGLRYYPGGFDNLEGFYLEATVSFRKYSYSNPTFSPTISTITPGYTFLDEQFKFGYVSSHWFSDFVYEFYIGIGVRNVTANMYEGLNEINSSGNVTEYYKPVTLKATYPQPLLGFKLGYPF
jgi:hypothetical protein